MIVHMAKITWCFLTCGVNIKVRSGDTKSICSLTGKLKIKCGSVGRKFSKQISISNKTKRWRLKQIREKISLRYSVITPKSVIKLFSSKRILWTFDHQSYMSFSSSCYQNSSRECTVLLLLLLRYPNKMGRSIN